MEIWDLYDQNRHIIGEHIRGEELPENAYHLVVHVWIKNQKGQFLISKRSAACKLNPLIWECTGGSVLKGETSLQAALREAYEEVGTNLDLHKGKFLFSTLRGKINGQKFNDILDVWLFDYEGDASLKRATTNEVCAVKWLYPNEILGLYQSGDFAPTLKYFFDTPELSCCNV